MDQLGAGDGGEDGFADVQRRVGGVDVHAVAVGEVDVVEVDRGAVDAHVLVDGAAVGGGGVFDVGEGEAIVLGGVAELDVGPVAGGVGVSGEADVFVVGALGGELAVDDEAGLVGEVDGGAGLDGERCARGDGEITFDEVWSSGGGPGVVAGEGAGGDGLDVAVVVPDVEGLADQFLAGVVVRA